MNVNLPHPDSTPTPAAEPYTVTVADLPCGHITGDGCTADCAYWWGVANGDYPPPEAYAGPAYAAAIVAGAA